MIQRIQTLYLLLTAFLAVLFLTGSFFTFRSAEGSDLLLKISGVYPASGEPEIKKMASSLFLSIVLIMIPVVSVVTIFLFKNRKLQMKLTMGVILLILVLITLSVITVFNVSAEFNVTLFPGFKLLLPLLMLVSAILSFRATKKDEELVRSYDRLR